MSAFMRRGPSVSCEATHNPAAPLSDGEIRCPERQFDLIAAMRCTQDLACPRARTCPLRTQAEAAMVGALGGSDPAGATARRGARAARDKPRAHDCLCCPRLIVGKGRTCSPECAAKWATYEAAMSGDGRNRWARRTGVAVRMDWRPQPLLVGKGKRLTTLQHNPGRKTP